MTATSNSRFLQTIPLVLVMVFLCPFVYSREIYVDDDGPADFDNIQAGIDTAEYGDAVCVAPGIYYENITMKNGINLLGAGADVTIIDANGYGDVVDVQANGVTISGFTLKNSGESDLWHMNCGVHVDGSYAPIIRKNVMVHNKIGIGLWDGANPDIRNNIIRNNYDGLYIYGSEGRPSNPAIINNTIVDNEMEGIILRQMVSPVIVNNIVTGHVTGINRNYVIGSPTLTYNNLWDNDVNYMRDNSIDDTLAGPGSISVDPLFADPNNGDFHLKSESGRWNPNDESWIIDDITSPCIDAGDPNSPIGEEPEPNSGIINIGAYGGTAEASKSPLVLQTRYGGGTGEPNNPYQIATAEDLMLLGESPEDYDKHFILTADIDLDPNLPGRKVFDKAVIANFCFRSVFDGHGHTISHLTINGAGHLGLFYELAAGAEVRDLAVVDVKVHGSDNFVGGLVGINDSGTVTRCCSTGEVNGAHTVGGLVGWNKLGIVSQCYSTSEVKGAGYVGGLVGWNESGMVTQCYSTGRISGSERVVGGLVGSNDGAVIQCYSSGRVSGSEWVIGGLVGSNDGVVIQCYSTGEVKGTVYVGGLVGSNNHAVANCYSTGAVSGDDLVGGLAGGNFSGYLTQCYSTGLVTGGANVGGLVGGSTIADLGLLHSGIAIECFWDTQTSGQATSEGGMGLTTAEMHDIQTYLDAGWDFVDEIRNGISQIWQMPEEGGYPVPAIFNGYIPPQLQGTGEPESPYMISDALDLGAIVYYNPQAQYRLVTSIDLSDICWGLAVIPWFAGIFNGNGHTISNLTVRGGGELGLFGQLTSGAEVKDLGVVDVNIIGSYDDVGGLVGYNEGAVNQCYSTGRISSSERGVGGLMGRNHGTVIKCYNTGVVSGGGGNIGGLVGSNSPFSVVTYCYSTGAVSGSGALFHRGVGGLVGDNSPFSVVTNCYSTGAVSGTDAYVGGLVGDGYGVTGSFWDTQTSGQAKSRGGIGKTTAQMQTVATFLNAGWDFVDETANGTEDIWWIDEGKDYPRLWWELIENNPSDEGIQ